MQQEEFNRVLQQYAYAYPVSSVALTPASPRESARMQVCSTRTGDVSYSTFNELPQYLPKGALLIFNTTKVLPVRLWAQRVGAPSHETIEIFVTTLGADGYTARVLSNRKVAVGDRLVVAGTVFELCTKEGKESVVRIIPGESERDRALLKTVREVIEEMGETPLPPYLKDTQMSEDDLRREYQSIFAKDEGAVAAPTASLHFSEPLVAALDERGVERAYVTLHVGLGTFAPLTKEHLETSTLHEERYVVPKETIEALRRAHEEGRPIIPIGTTALRTIETVAADILKMPSSQIGELPGISGSTSLFITPGYEFRLATGLVTNFHIPSSSLMMLVAAFVGRERLLELYRDAIAHDFRLFSFGDGQLII